MIKKYGFYLLFTLVIFAGQFLRDGDLVTGKPPFSEGAGVNGVPVNTFLGKGPAIIYFWAEWCGVCQMMQSGFNKVVGDYPLVTVAFQSGDSTAVQAYLRQKQLAWPVLNDPQGTNAKSFGVTAVPTLFFTNSRGDIVFTTVGYTSELGLRIRTWLAGFI
ncbi:redoxin domain-containing protein [Methylomonas paludis]|uniref:Redoxin domain-containing protein n=1 Tax=Methylomonas paludis TaxID=1173101 RepID=A0A975MQU5_9GAMM|nr:redoxin domain-containing protein [Methylomonas paludis]QWF72312.1 redoxin domain-containing protein [Methylomonas paludis]